MHGIDASAAMLERLRAKPGGDAIPVTLGDMADLDLPDPPPFAVVLAAFNTFFNLTSLDAQQRCLDGWPRSSRPPGSSSSRRSCPPTTTLRPAARSSPRHLTADEVVLTVSQHDRAEQTITGQHIHLTEAGIRLRPWHLRYAGPDELDAMAAAAGLELAWRHADWAGAPFGPDVERPRVRLPSR